MAETRPLSRLIPQRWLVQIQPRHQTRHLKITGAGDFSFAAGIVARTELLARRPVEDSDIP